MRLMLSVDLLSFELKVLVPTLVGSQNSPDSGGAMETNKSVSRTQPH